MSGVIDRPGKRSHRFAFPDDLEIPESALADRKFLSSFVHIYNDPRVYKRQRLNGDRTSSRFDVDYNYQIKVVFNEPIVKRKSILSNPQSPKDDSGVRKSVSFLSKITVIDSIDLDGGSSDWTDVEHDESPEKSKLTKSKISNNGKSESKTKKSTQSNGKTSIKENKKKMKDKPSTKNGHKVKSAQKELFKFKITKTFRKFGRSKDKKLKHLQKKFGRRMFKAFVQVKRSFNLKTIPSNVTVPLERITRKIDDVTTPEKSVPSIQDFLISKMTRKVKVTLTPVHGNTGDTNRSTINGDSEIMQNHTIESNSLNAIENFSRTEIYVPSDKVVDSQTATDDSETNQHIEESIDKSHTSTTPTSVHQTIENHHIIKSNGNGSVETNDSSDEKTESCNHTEPSPEVVELNPLPNLIDKITCNMYYNTNTNKDETVTISGQMLETNNDDHHMDLVENISTTFNVSFSMPSTKSLTDNILGCDSPEIASIQLKLND